MVVPTRCAVHCPSRIRAAPEDGIHPIWSTQVIAGACRWRLTGIQEFPPLTARFGAVSTSHELTSLSIIFASSLAGQAIFQCGEGADGLGVLLRIAGNAGRMRGILQPQRQPEPASCVVLDPRARSGQDRRSRIFMAFRWTGSGLAGHRIIAIRLAMFDNVVEIGENVPFVDAA